VPVCLCTGRDPPKLGTAETGRPQKSAPKETEP
jgi:hypothetical protein